jgi:hypothetical protein
VLGILLGKLKIIWAGAGVAQLVTSPQKPEPLSPGPSESRFPICITRAEKLCKALARQPSEQKVVGARYISPMMTRRRSSESAPHTGRLRPSQSSRRLGGGVVTIMNRARSLIL